MRTTTARLAAVMAVAALLVAVGCAQEEDILTGPPPPATATSNEAPGSTEPASDADLCDLVDELADTNPEDVLGALDVLDELRLVAPDDVVADVDVMIDINEQYLGLDEQQNYDLGEELDGDRDFLDAAANLDEFALDECGTEIGFFIPFGPDRRTAPLDPDLFPDATSGGLPSGDDDPTSIDSLQAHLEKEYGTEDWWPVLDDATSWSSSGFSDVVEWEVTLSSSPASSALPVTSLTAACDAMASYLDSYEDRDVEVTIASSDGVALVARKAGESCAAA